MEPMIEPSRLQSRIESVLLAAGSPVATAILAQATGATRSQVVMALEDLKSMLSGGIRLQVHGESAQLVTAPENADTVHRFLGTAKPSALSRSALETLAVVAYRQPVTRAEIEATRGTNSDRAVRTLLARELIEERGARATVGRPMQYGTSFAFLEYFGLSSVDDLPDLPEIVRLPAHQLGLRATQADQE